MPPKNASAYQGQRHYQWQGRKLPSVTTILQSYPKPWLGAWAAKMVAEAAVNEMDGDHPELTWFNMARDDAIRHLKGSPWRKRDAAADFGTALHEGLAALVRGGSMSSIPGAEEHLGALVEWWYTYRPQVLDSEVQVFAPDAGYAGSLDMIAEVDGRRLLIDLKSGNAVGHDARLQLAAYRYAEFIGEDDKRIAAMPEVQGCAILWVPRDDPAHWQFLEVEAGGAEYDLFTGLIPLLAFTKANDKAAVGSQILPQVEVA